MTFRTRSLLETALLGQKKFADAEPWITRHPLDDNRKQQVVAVAVAITCTSLELLRVVSFKRANIGR